LDKAPSTIAKLNKNMNKMIELKKEESEIDAKIE
jgi:hypothetical protein